MNTEIGDRQNVRLWFFRDKDEFCLFLIIFAFSFKSSLNRYQTIKFNKIFRAFFNLNKLDTTKTIIDVRFYD